MIAKRMGFQHISMDKVFSQTKIDTVAAIEPLENLAFISSKVALFIRVKMIPISVCLKRENYKIDTTMATPIRIVYQNKGRFATTIINAIPIS